MVTDAGLTAEPLARPGEVIRRPRGDMAAMLAATPKVEKPAKAENKAAEGRKPTPAHLVKAEGLRAQVHVKPPAPLRPRLPGIV